MSGGDWKEMLVAVQNGDIALVKYHMENGIDPNYEHPELMTTPLIESISNGHDDVTKYLLEKGADPTLKAWISNDSPLTTAKKSERKDLVRLLKAYVPKKKRRWWIFG